MDTSNAIITRGRALAASDMIYATLEAGGNVLAKLCKANFSSIDEVVRQLTALAGRYFGLARLRIRNMTQGWNINLSVASRRKPAAAKRVTTPPTAARHNATQHTADATRNAEHTRYFQPSLFAM